MMIFRYFPNNVLVLQKVIFLPLQLALTPRCFLCSLTNKGAIEVETTFADRLNLSIGPRRFMQTTVPKASINSRLNVVVRSPIPFGLDQNGYGPSQGSQLLWILPSHKPFFCRAAP